MPLETANYIAQLNSANPPGTDPKSQGDDHLRMIKSALQATFPGFNGAFQRVQMKPTAFQPSLNDNGSLFDVTAGSAVTLDVAATYGNGWCVGIRANGTAVVVTPTVPETVNTLTSVTVPAGQIAYIWCDGSQFYAAFMPATAAWTSTYQGAGSGMDSDLLDGQHGAFYQNASNINAGTLNAARLPASGVTANTYGAAATVPVITVDVAGRITLAVDTAIQIAESQVTNLVADLAAKQPLDATLTALAGLTTGADLLPYFTGTDTSTTTALTAFARTLLDDTTQGAMQATLGLVPGTNVQAYDATLAALAAQNWVANAIPIGSGADAVAQVSFAANTFPGRSSTGNLVAKAITDLAFSLLDDTTTGAMQSTLGLVIGTNVQAFDAELAAIAGLVSAADQLPYFTGSGTAALTSFTATARSLLDDTSTSAMRTTLGLVIGTDVQAQDAELAAIAGLTSAADRLPYFTGLGTAALATFTAAGRALVDDADATAQRATLGLVIGTNVQAYDATLQSLSALGTVADRIAYTTGVDTWAETPLTSFMRTVLDDTTAAAAAATLSVLPLAGGTLTGALTLSGDGTNALHAVTKQQLDAIGSGIRVVQECRVATTSALTFTISGGAVTQINGTSVDGVSLSIGDRIVVKDAPASTGAGSADSTQPANGIYKVDGNTTNLTVSRATDADTGTELVGLLTFVTAGTANVGKQFYQNVPATITLNTTALRFVVYYAPASYVGGNGLTLSGLTFNVGTASTARIVVNADDIDLATTAVTAASYGSASSVATFTVDAYGRLTAAASTSIAIAESQVTNLVSDLAGKQPLDATLTALAGVTTAADTLIYATAADTFTTTAFTATARSLLDDASTSAMRTTLGLVIGTDVQAQDAELSAIAGLVSAADTLPYFTGAGTAALTTFTAAGRALVDDASAAAQRTTLGLVIGTDVQAFDATLAAFAALTIAADTLTIGTGADAFSQTSFGANTFPAKASTGALVAKTITDFALTILDDANAATVLATIGAAASGANTDLTSVYLNNTGLKIKDTNASHGLIIAPGSDITADRTLTITTGDASRTLTLSANLTVSATATVSGTNTGDQTITLTGDVTGTGTGSFATTIANNAVTNAKAADMATNTIKARVTAGTGDPEDVAIAANQFLARSSTGQLAAKAITDFGFSLVDDTDATAARTTLGLVIGTNVQAQDATLQSIAALGSAADKMLYTTALDTWAETAITAFGRSLIDDAAAVNARSTLGLVIGTDVQAYDANTAKINVVQVWTKAQGSARVALTDAATVAVDASLSNVFTVTLGGNRTLGQPTNPSDGQSITIYITQDATGSRTLAYHADWLFAGGTDPVLSTAANSVDVLTAIYHAGTTKWYAQLTKAYA